MGACVSQQTDPCNATQGVIVDVQKVIADYIWVDFRNSHPSWFSRRSLRRKDHRIDVPMNFYLFETTKQELAFRKQKSDDSKDTCPSPSEQNPHPNKLSPQSRELNPKHNTFKTQFRNDTRETQTYHFSFEKTRCSSATVSYQKGFSFGGSTDFSISLPGGQMGAEIGMSLQVTNTEEQMFEESSTTVMTSEVIVSPHSHCGVNVVLDDNHFTATFKLNVAMTLPQKMANIFIYNKRGKLVSMAVLGDLSFVFPEYPKKDDRGKDRKDAVEFTVEGVVKATQVSHQNIHLNSQDIPPTTNA